jgi:adenylosuccinate lyase
MLKRYALPPMQDLWVRPETKFEFWLKVEMAFLYARVKIGKLPADVYALIEQHAKINVDRIEAIEKDTRHDLIAFVTDIQQSLSEAGVGECGKEFHKYLTSYDTEDPAQILMLRQAVGLIIHELKALEAALWQAAQERQWTEMMADTHGQDAEPSTFGALLLVYKEAVGRSIGRFQRVLDYELNEGKISGAVGNFAGLDPALEKIALSRLGLDPAKAETQILQRDRQAALMSAVAIAGATIEQICRTFWERMQSRVRELEEPRSAKQKGSSAMAHKKNPIMVEQLQGLARMLRGYLQPVIEDVATPGWRDISQSCVERIALADATTLLHYMAVKMTGIVQGMTVFANRMHDNLVHASLGVWAGQQVRNALMEAGVDYESAYRYVQTASFEAVQTGHNMEIVFSNKSLSADDTRTAYEILGAERLHSCFDVQAYIKPGIIELFLRQQEPFKRRSSTSN